MEKEERKGVQIRLFSPLQGRFYDSEDYCKEFSGGGLYGYDREIRKALDENRAQGPEAGLRECLKEGALKEKVIRMQPGIDIWLYSVWSVLTVDCTQELSAAELEELKNEWHGQMNDGWGEDFTQQEIDCDFGCRLYVDFRTYSRDKIRTEQELKGNQEKAW